MIQIYQDLCLKDSQYSDVTVLRVPIDCESNCLGDTRGDSFSGIACGAKRFGAYTCIEAAKSVISGERY
jgi:hypothetical protein